MNSFIGGMLLGSFVTCVAAATVDVTLGNTVSRWVPMSFTTFLLFVVYECVHFVFQERREKRKLKKVAP